MSKALLATALAATVLISSTDATCFGTSEVCAKMNKMPTQINPQPIRPCWGINCGGRNIVWEEEEQGLGLKRLRVSKGVKATKTTQQALFQEDDVVEDKEDIHIKKIVDRFIAMKKVTNPSYQLTQGDYFYKALKMFYPVKTDFVRYARLYGPIKLQPIIQFDEDEIFMALFDEEEEEEQYELQGTYRNQSPPVYQQATQPEIDQRAYDRTVAHINFQRNIDPNYKLTQSEYFSKCDLRVIPNADDIQRYERIIRRLEQAGIYYN